MKFIIIILLFISIINAIEQDTLQFLGVACKHHTEDLIIKRDIPKKCKKIEITAENVFGDNLANEKISKDCKKTFATFLGTVQPISLGNGIKTVGEIEVLKFLKLIGESSDKYALVDTRVDGWYGELTLPHAINIPYTDIAYDKFFPDDFEKNLCKLNVFEKKGILDFSKAKTIITFCNGIWCSQSAQAIEQLLILGYPSEKILWYRGGLQDWSSMGFTTIKP